MNAFLTNAEELFATARQDAGADCQFSVLVGTEGGIYMVYESDWGLEPLRQHHGARAAYRVTRSAGSVALEGRSAGASCRMEAARGFAVGTARAHPTIRDDLNRARTRGTDRLPAPH